MASLRADLCRGCSVLGALAGLLATACGGRVVVAEDSRDSGGAGTTTPPAGGGDIAITPPSTPATCRRGEPPVVLAEGRLGTSIAVDGGWVYWTDDSGDGGARRVAAAGGPVLELGPARDSWGLAVGAGGVYFAERVSAGAIFRWNGGKAASPLATIDTGAYGLAVDASHVYFAMGDTVGRVPLAGGPTERIARGSGATHVQVDATHAYFTNWSGPVMRVPLAGGAAETIASAEYAYDLALDEDSVYFVTGGTSSALYKVPKAGGATTVLGRGADLNDVVVRDGWVWWTEMSGDAIWRTRASGGTPELVVRTVSPRALAVDASCVYWVSTNITVEGVMRAPR